MAETLLRQQPGQDIIKVFDKVLGYVPKSGQGSKVLDQISHGVRVLG